jgi:hypothetical protein
MTFRLEAVAPRLALARDQHNALVSEQDRLRHVRIAKTLDCERLVAHRQLQLQRAFVTGNGRYIAHRQKKLQAAERALARWKAL